MSSRFVLPFADVGSGITPPSGAQLFFFETGTSTPKDTFSDQKSTPTKNANPVDANSKGVFPNIFISGKYKVVLKNKNGTQIWEADPIEEFVTIQDNAFIKNFLTVEGGAAETSAVENISLNPAGGEALNIKERTDGNGGGALWDTVIASTVTPNTYNIIICTGVPTLALVLRAPYSMAKLGAGTGSDDTAAAVILNALTKTMVFDVDKTFELINFVPLVGTTIEAKGSTIKRFSNTTHNSTGSSSSIVIENNDITIKGGTHTLGAGATRGLSWSGSVLIDGGNDLKIKAELLVFGGIK